VMAPIEGGCICDANQSDVLMRNMTHDYMWILLLGVENRDNNSV